LPENFPLWVIKIFPKFYSYAEKNTPATTRSGGFVKIKLSRLISVISYWFLFLIDFSFSDSSITCFLLVSFANGKMAFGRLPDMFKFAEIRIYLSENT